MYIHIGKLAATMLVIGSVGQTVEQPKQPKKVLAGWIDVFPTIGGYHLTFRPAVIEGDKKDPSYRQVADYIWMGGADRNITVTVARDPNFKKRHSDEEIKKSQPAPEKIEVAKHTAWLWVFDKDKKDARPVVAKLLVILGDDLALTIEQKGLGPFTEKMPALANQYDLAKIKAALANPPDTGSHRTVAAFGQLKKGMSYANVMLWVGPAEKDIGSGIHIMVYTLDDGSQVMLGFPDFNALIYVKHQTKDGKTVDLVN